MDRPLQFRARRVDCGAWFFRVIAWDGLLPLAIVALPHFVEAIFPRQREVLEATSVIVPIAAFFFRLRHGKSQIASNHCSRAVRCVQYVAFCCGILPLALIDCVLMLSHLMPPGALFQARADRIVWAVLAGIYLTAMIVAMYPGRTAIEDDWEIRFATVQAELERRPRRDW